MSYGSGMLKRRVRIIHPRRVDGLTGEGTGWEWGHWIWAAVDWSRGTRALRQGEVEAYDVVMVRTRWHGNIDRYCRLWYDGQYFAVDNFHADRQANTIQITAVEIGAFAVDEPEDGEGKN
ncbi:MAG: head-tail adaptor protein [Bacteroidales bacterium]|nr:head-tail adaptor protein [Bacteroidales bacterium]